MLFRGRLMDEAIVALRRDRYPDYVVSYLAHRTCLEPEQGNFDLVCIRRIAQRLSENSDALKDCILSLCQLAIRKIRHILSYRRTPDMSEQSRRYRLGVQTAAIYQASYPETVVLGLPGSDSEYFGSAADLVVRSGSERMVDDFLNNGSVRKRSHILKFAARRGDYRLLQQIYNFRIETCPWHFDKSNRLFSHEFLAIRRCFYTPNPEIWKWALAISKENEFHVPKSSHGYVIVQCAKKGWHETVDHMLNHDAHETILDAIAIQNSILEAAKMGHTRLIEVIFAHGIQPHDCAMLAGAANGQTQIIKMLMMYDLTMNGTVVSAAKGDHARTVGFLLAEGGNADEEDEDLSALCYAVLHEDTKMFENLRQYGARLPSREMFELCEQKAKKNGVESMLNLLKAQGSISEEVLGE